MRTLGAMIAAGGRGLARCPGLLFALYLLQLLISAAVGAVVATALIAPLARRSVFDDMVDGDLFALVAIVTEHAELFVALAWIAIATGLLYGALSWFLTGGLIAVLADDTSPRARGATARTFGAGGAALLFPYARLWLWSLIPYAIVGVAAAIGLAPAADAFREALTFGEVARAAVIGALPAAALWLVLRTALDYARVELLLTPGLGSGRALLRALRFVARHPIALAHIAFYCAVSGGIAIAYLAVTWGQPMLGVAGAFGLFALRQATSVTRTALHATLIGGQIRLRRQ